MAIEHTSRGVPYPDGDEPNNVPLYMELLAEWVNDNTIGSGDIPAADVAWGDIADKPAAFPPTTHNHDTRYYTESEVNDFFTASDAAVAAKAPKVNPTLTGTVTLGGADTDVIKQRAAAIETDDRPLTFGYTGSDLTSIVEMDGVTTVKTTTLTWSSGRVATVAETAGGVTVTTTLTYDGTGLLTGATRSVA